MKNSIILFLLGFFVAISFAATTNNLLTVKPTTPISVVKVDSFEDARPYIRNGYVIKSSGGGDYHNYLILEKY